MNDFHSSDASFLVKVGIVLVLILGVALYYASYAIKDYKHDNALEEIIEKVIEKNTGITVDLSPESPEK
jgi:ABC-type glycerol-3-phosphate transport system substrate-binding protein